MPRTSFAVFIALIALLAAQPAFAHHALMPGQPLHFELAFISGIAHPMINFEHFAYVVAIGVLAAVGQGSKFLPFWFVAGTILGCLMAVSGFVIPYDKWLILVALVVIGAALVWGRQRLGIVDIGAFLVTGVLHGSVYAESIIGNVTSSVAGYLLGFAIIQTVVATGAMYAAYALWRGDKLYENARVIGGAVAGVGLTIIGQGLVQALLPVAA